MEQSEKNCKLLLEHYQTYPQLQIQDIFKYLHQSSFGCEHMVSSLHAATDYIRSEYVAASPNGERLIDHLDGAYARVHLAYLHHGLSAGTLAKLFFLSRKSEPDGKNSLEHKLSAATELIREGALPFSLNKFERELAAWQADGYPAIHHSELFHTAYRPAYRVIASRYTAFLPLLARLDGFLQKGSATIAIDGGSASGKTTLSEILAELYDCAVFHMDDFFLRPEQRTAERYAQPGGNVDRERFREEVLTPLSKMEPVYYRRFDCASFTIAGPTIIPPKRLNIIEGAYAMHPELAGYYDFSVFLDIHPALQKARIAKRNTPHMAKRFYDEWIPLENIYISQMNVKERCDLIIPVYR